MKIIRVDENLMNEVTEKNYKLSKQGFLIARKNIYDIIKISKLIHSPNSITKFDALGVAWNAQVVWKSNFSCGPEAPSGGRYIFQRYIFLALL